MTSPFARAIRRKWLMKELYGSPHAPSADSCSREPYLYANLLLRASGASPHQRDYVLGMLYTQYNGALDSDLVQYVTHYTPQSVALHLSGEPCDRATSSDDETVSDPSLPDAMMHHTSVSGEGSCEDEAFSGRPRLLMYDALCASRCASLSEQQRSEAQLSDVERSVARQLGIADSVAARMADLCNREAALVSHRHRLISPTAETEPPSTDATR